MKLAYFDCFSGISGDMTLGALVDAGCDLEHLRAGLRGLQARGWELDADKVWKNGMAATCVKVKTEDQQKHRSLGAILDILQKSQLAPEVRHRAAEIFVKLGEAEAHVHDVPLEKIHFHEVGAVDAIVDIVGACIGFHALGIAKFACSPLNIGGGTAKNAARNFVRRRSRRLHVPGEDEKESSGHAAHGLVQAAGYQLVDVAHLCRNNYLWRAHLSRATPHPASRVCKRRHKFRRRAHQDFPCEWQNPARRTRVRRLPQTRRRKERPSSAGDQRSITRLRGAFVIGFVGARYIVPSLIFLWSGLITDN